MVPFQSRPETVKRLEAITDYLKAQKPGDTVTWLELEKETGVAMRSPAVQGEDGRALTRRALHRLGLEVETIVGVGFRLSAADNALVILGEHLVRARRKLVRAATTAKSLHDRHHKELSRDARDRLTRSHALLSTLVSQSTDARKQLLK